MALFRAIETSRPAESRLFSDPFAPLFLRPSFKLVVRLSRLAILRAVVPRVIDFIVPGARSSAVARTRLIDDWLCAAVREIDQVVILGAGFDCRAYRMPALGRLPVFEVDHPDTIEQKRRRLERALGALPRNVRFVATDFDQRSAGEALGTTDHDPARRTFFVWEGVTNYLSASSVDRTFRWIGTAPAGSLAAFTYVHRGVLEQPDSFYGARRLLRHLERLGEPWTFGVDPVEMPSYLSARNLTVIEDAGAREYRERYLKDRRGGTRGYEFYRVALARARPS